MHIEQLINELEEEHKVILNLLNEIKSGSLFTEKGIKQTIKLKELLLEHLKKEDEEFYPYIREKTKTNKSLKGVYDKFIYETEEITEQILSFFEDIKNNNHIEAAIKLGKIKGVLKGRIIREEAVLYKRAIS